MTVFFTDSSAVAKRYITEKGSVWIRQHFEPVSGNSVIVSELAGVEVRKVFTQLHVDRRLGIRDMVRLRNDFLIHLRNEYFVITPDIDLFEQAAQLIRKHGLLAAYVLRSMDAIQLAAAIQAAGTLQTQVTMVSSDQRLLKA